VIPIHVIDALHACRNLETTPFGFFEGLKTMTLLTTLFVACRKAKVLVHREREREREIQGHFYRESLVLMLR
jgi:hypothetical protein